MATLTRKSKSMELLTKEEMITYHKGNNIPTSHIQLHDPDSVTAAVNIFRVIIYNILIKLQVIGSVIRLNYCAQVKIKLNYYSCI